MFAEMVRCLLHSLGKKNCRTFADRLVVLTSLYSLIAHLISSTQKSFNPQRYLYAVHADTSYDDLVVGVDRLKASIDQRSSALKVLVQNNFDRFVSAKNVIDCEFYHSMSTVVSLSRSRQLMELFLFSPPLAVYDDMKEKTLNEAQDFGTHRLNTILRGMIHWRGTSCLRRKTHIVDRAFPI